jgi:hypothetical protein
VHTGYKLYRYHTGAVAIWWYIMPLDRFDGVFVNGLVATTLEFALTMY